jgi:hypothetical protein
MKNLVVIALFLVAFSACDQSNNSNTKGITADAIEHSEGEGVEPKFEFEETSWDFGEIVEGERVEHTFKFKNVGNDDLVISNVTSSCGCTSPNWPRKPIKPGESSKITVEFNSQNKSGIVTKDVNIFANTIPTKTVLKIKTIVNKE